MKKTFSLFIAVFLVFACFASFTAFAEQGPETVYNLISEDAEITYTEVNGVTATATFDENGRLTVKADEQWPKVTLEYEVPYTFEVEKATLRVKFELKGSGGTSIRILTSDSEASGSINEVFVHHFLEDVSYDTAGDLITHGVYEFELPFSELAFCDWTQAAGYMGKLPIEKDELSFTYLEIFSVGGAEVIIETLEVVVEGPDVIEVPSDEEPSEPPAETSVPAETSEPAAPPTGDAGIIALLVISAVSLAGAVVIKRR
ncbi:MAG: hypothetical protein WCR95_02635 [Eubacteriales bacterium]